MTYADQGTLADRLEVEGLTTRQALEVVRQVALGLQALHDRDILHRDVGDLGLGKSLDMSSRLTMVAGTPSFVAPEQAQAEPLDARADQYSLVSAPGTAPSASGAEGVFLGLLPGDSLPSAGEAVPARP
jgi:serine/threonine protein kinase